MNEQMDRRTKDQKNRREDEEQKWTAVETEKPQDLGEDFFLPLKG